MYKICKTEQSAARQRELEQFLLRELLERRYEDISISDLCDGVGIPRKAFYRYFSGKKGALHALMDHTIMDLDTIVVELTVGDTMDYQLFLSRYFRYWREQKDLLDAIERSNLWEEFMERTEMYTLEELERNSRFAPQEVQDERFFQNRFAIFGLIGILQAWYRRDFRPEVGKMVAIAESSLLASISIARKI